MSTAAQRAARPQHLLGLEAMDREAITALLDRAEALAALSPPVRRTVLAGRTLATLFFEPSTRTRMSFQLAAQRLGMDAIDLNVSMASTSKGETESDTLRTLAAMGVDAFVVRHKIEGTVGALAAELDPGVALISAGEGRSHHPTQGLLDMLSLRQAKGADFSRLRVLIAGDIRHSRVARSDLHALRALGCRQIRLCGPASLLPDPAEWPGCEAVDDFDAAVEGVDALFMLRLQRERMSEGLVPSLEAYYRDYGLTEARLARAAPDAVVLHPGPINRGVEISDAVADGPRSLILRQVANGVAIRMAVLDWLLGQGDD